MENLSMMERSPLVEGEIHGKVNTSLKRKVGYDNSDGKEDECVFLFERLKKRTQQEGSSGSI
jgi:hypothetical protein